MEETTNRLEEATTLAHPETVLELLAAVRLILVPVLSRLLPRLLYINATLTRV